MSILNEKEVRNLIENLLTIADGGNDHLHIATVFDEDGTEYAITLNAVNLTGLKEFPKDLSLTRNAPVMHLKDGYIIAEVD